MSLRNGGDTVSNLIEAFTRVTMHWRADRQVAGFDLIGEIELGNRAFKAWARAR